MSQSCLSDLDYIYRVLEDMPKLIGMDIMQGPFVWPCRVASNEGVTGVVLVAGLVIITTSHLSIHTWPNRHYLSFDCYSCNDFDDKFVVAEIQRRFEPKTLRQSVIPREMPPPRQCCAAFRKEGT
jgi:S-adenosylmethionine decarboxylase